MAILKTVSRARPKNSYEYHQNCLFFRETKTRNKEKTSRTGNSFHTIFRLIVGFTVPIMIHRNSVLCSWYAFYSTLNIKVIENNRTKSTFFSGSSIAVFEFTSLSNISIKFIRFSTSDQLYLIRNVYLFIKYNYQCYVN
jgi:hypothetical protein